MGVRGLWNVSNLHLCSLPTRLTHNWQKIAHTAETCSYTELSLRDGYDRGEEGFKTLVVGVDIRYTIT